ncbi:MAG TPA: histidinol dehydrogenase [Candidatus Marinimicrobia bacterium]|nr:histidinol dehydrogenase [Candidatus Neomarinimicrobiota bacterium]
MKIYEYPKRNKWRLLVQRPANSAEIAEDRVLQILAAVRNKGDAAVRAFNRKFDGVDLRELLVSEAEIAAAGQNISAELKAAIQLAIDNITKFHAAQLHSEVVIETSPGVRCWRRSVPIERVGLYIPGGTAPLFSTVLMLAIPAKIAGCPEIILCSPPQKNGRLHPLILYVAKITGVDKMFKVGGAQAVAAMAYGTESIPGVDKIFGPGNSWVTMAKQLVNRQGVAIDLPAGPSEVAVIADESAEPEFVALDLLSQAEHGTDSQVMLITSSPAIVKAVESKINELLPFLSRKDIAEQALANSRAILLKDPAEMMEFANAYAPEHLIIMTENAVALSAKVINAGSVFIGAYTPESAGDYASGTNHTLPTYGYARSLSGVSVDSFVKKITFQTISEKGLRSIGSAVECMAAAEGLDAHQTAVSLRLAALEKGSAR